MSHPKYLIAVLRRYTYVGMCVKKSSDIEHIDFDSKYINDKCLSDPFSVVKVVNRYENLLSCVQSYANIKLILNTGDSNSISKPMDTNMHIITLCTRLRYQGVNESTLIILFLMENFMNTN